MLLLETCWGSSHFAHSGCLLIAEPSVLCSFYVSSCQPRMILPHGGHLDISEKFLIVTTYGGEVLLLASGELRPGMPLNIVQ